ncbi:sugar ABC transporter ATP-binding protein [Nocardioides humi]|uniref:Sugar ABC transporter ATP-binding protein n=1 Tax=Nocardioides humi TaxID=449461 RepID=A0ABN2AT94_9ACTN|nr:sugar ABC transporter ATP-binding protein [Nocardioides humi]
MAENPEAPGSIDGESPILDVQGLVKQYPGTRALDSADFSLRSGEIHTLVGSNGAGKSTLVKMISGRERPDRGRLLVDGELVEPGVANYLTRYSIGYVSQEGSLDPELTAYENVYLGRELTTRGLVSYRRMRREARALADEFGFAVDLDRRVRELSPPDRKVVEILRALSVRPRILILDEPTAAIPKPDIEHLLGLMRTLRSRASIIFISHYMEEIFSVSDRITVMRDGRRVWVGDAADTAPDRLVAGMLGDKAYRAHQAVGSHSRVERASEGPVRLAVEGLRTRDGAVEDASLTVRGGEVVGLFGMVGAGKTELLEALYGMRRSESATFDVGGGGDGGRWSVRSAQTAGVALVPEDRLKNALVGEETGGWNLAAPHWRRAPRLFPRLGRLEAGLSEQARGLVTIKGDVTGQPISTLSGGNKQKVSVCRWLVNGRPPEILLLDEPTQGLDVVAREEIYQLIRRLADDGTAVVLASSDLDEAVTVSDRVVVMKAGTTREMQPDQQSRDSLLLEATSDVGAERGTDHV